MMTKLLAIDASTELCSVALLSNNEIIERLSDVPRSHASCLLPMVDELLAQAGLRLQDMDAIAFGAGPGSFTGLRICVGVAQGLGFAADLPLVPVSSLQAIAYEVSQLQPDITHVVPAIDARMNEVYWAVYAAGSEYPRSLSEPRVSALSLADSELYDLLSTRTDSQQWYGAGSGWALLQNSADSLQQMSLNLWPKASAVASLAKHSLAAGEITTAAQAEPIYLRNEVSWQKRAPARRQ